MAAALSIRSGKNSWRLRYRVKGKRFSKIVEGTKIEAARQLRELLHSGDRGAHVAPSKMTLAKWIGEWLELKRRSIKPRTLEGYEDMLSRHVIPTLGDTALQKITATDIDKLYGKLTLAASTAQVLHTVLKAVFTSAVKKKLRADNPVSDAEKPAGEPSEEGAILEEEELGRLVKGFRGISLYPIVAVAAFTGMRWNEVLALRWVDVDLDAGAITVSRNVEETKAGGRRIGTPKSKQGFRTFQIESDLVGLLRKEREKHLQLVAGIPDGAEVDLSLIKLPTDALCFPVIGADLTAIRCPSGVTTSFLKKARRLGFTNVHLHDLRASHETALLDRGVPVHVVAERTKKADANAASVIGTLMKWVL